MKTQRVRNLMLITATTSLLLMIATNWFSDAVENVTAQDAFRPNNSPAYDTGPAYEGGQRDRQVAGTENAGATTASIAAAMDLSSAFRQVAQSMRSSVVAVETRSVREPSPTIEDFLGRGRRRSRPREALGSGSGVIVRSDGYILTNNHVVEDSDEVKVELEDGRILPAEIVGLDPQTDLAVLKVQATGLKAASFGSSDDLRVGDWVLAIGSPFGLDQTVTAGIISGKNRVQGIINQGDGFEDFLQTDAAINPGNSGGPLVNLRGELVGINTAILSRSGTSAGIGFAIPVSMARPVLKSIIETGKVRRGFIGASVTGVTPDQVAKYDLKVNRGGLIDRVLDGQPAALAGLQPGDVVVEMDGKRVNGGTQLRNYVASRPPGSRVQLIVNRDGQVRQVQVQLQERTDQALAAVNPGLDLGAELVPLTSDIARRYGYPSGTDGLIVQQVRPGSVIDQLRLQEGDVIEQADGAVLRSAEQFGAILAEAKSDNAPIQVIARRGSARVLLRVLP